MLKPKNFTTLIVLIFILAVLFQFGTANPACAATVRLDSCDSISGWDSSNNLSLDTGDKKEGTGCLVSTGSGTVEFRKVFSPAVNSGVTPGLGYLQFWYFVSDLSKFNPEGQVEISSSGGCDVNEYSWDMASKVRPQLVNGWNLVKLKISEAGKIGSPNLGAINWFRIYQFVNGGITTKLDGIRFYDGDVDNCETTTGWASGNTLSLDSGDRKEGNASLKSVGSNEVEFQKVFSPAVASGVTESNGVLQFWYYVSDLSKFSSGGQVEVSSSGTCDVNEYNWDITGQVKPYLINGWNLVTLKLSEAGKMGNPDLNNINWIRLYQFTSGTVTTKLDEIRFVAVSGAAPPPVINASSVTDKVICGYQGWFLCSGDGSPINGWRHWAPGIPPSPGNQTFEVYPDIAEYDSVSLFNTNYAALGNGSPAQLFSSYKTETINKHFNWMRNYGIDGVALQRFGCELSDPVSLQNRNDIAVKVKNAAETYGRVFYIMYDISGMDPASWVSRIENDWNNQIKNSLNLPNSSRYLKQDGKTVVCIWGIGFTDRPGTAQESIDLINWFKGQNCYVIGGVPYWWRTCTNDSKTGFEGAYLAFDMISPWSVDRYETDAEIETCKNNNLIPDHDYCASFGIAYQPVIFPGFAWSNWNGGTQNMVPRRQGNLMWRQFYNLKTTGIPCFYIAMFDEYDEGTAILKAAEDSSMKPSNQYFLTMSQDGIFISSDFYLRLTQKATKVIKGMEGLTYGVPIPESAGPVYFRSSLETVDPVTSWVDSTEVLLNVGGYGGTGNPKCGIVTETAHRGSRAVKFSGRDNSTTGSYCYFKCFDVNIPVTVDTKLSFWTFPQQNLGRYVSVDLIMTDGTTLRDSGAVDDNGWNMHPGQGRGTVNAWTQTKCNIGQWLNGKTIDRILIAYDHAPETGDWSGYVDDIVITTGTLGY